MSKFGLQVTNLTFCIGDDTEYDRELSELMGMEDSDHEIKVARLGPCNALATPRPARPRPKRGIWLASALSGLGSRRAPCTLRVAATLDIARILIRRLQSVSNQHNRGLSRAVSGSGSGSGASVRQGGQCRREVNVDEKGRRFTSSLP